MDTVEIADPAVKAVFEAFPEGLGARLLGLRRHILAAAAAAPRIGEVTETLKWGEPAYLPSRPRIGSTVRLNPVKGSTDRYGLYFNCRTSLVDTFRQHYPGMFRLEGDRAMIFTLEDEIPAEPLRHCITLALTYHLK